jgi:hypothetical protein
VGEVGSARRENFEVWVGHEKFAVGGRVIFANRSGKAQGRQRKESKWGKEHLDPWHNAENATTL